MRVTGEGGRARTALALSTLVLSEALVVVAAPAGIAKSGSVVRMSLVEWSLAPKLVTARAGRVSFVVRNDGTMLHEFLVLRSDRHHHKLKVRGGKAVETGRVGRIPQIPSGATSRLTLKLPAGKYVLLCNLLGHYQAGQFAALRVR